MQNPQQAPTPDVGQLLATLAHATPGQLDQLAAVLSRLRGDRPASTASDASITLSQFYESWAEPVLFRERRRSTEKTIALYRNAIRHWVRLTGDPPLAAITDETLAAFVRSLESLPGRKTVGLSGYTVARHARAIQTILYRAGPPRLGIKHAQGIIDRVPQFGTIEQPRSECYGAFTPAELAALWEAAPRMTVPIAHGATPGEFWRGLLALGFYGMFRITSMMLLELADVAADGWTTIRDENAKRRRGYTVYLPRPALEAIAWGDPARSRVLPWANVERHGINTLRKRFNRLQTLAGIANHERRGFHGLRKAGATALAKIDPLAAQMQLGHAGGTILQAHYLSKNQVLIEAVDKMPWPFGGRDERDAEGAAA